MYLNKIKFEIEIFWRFIKNDILATVVPGLMVTLSAFYYKGDSLESLLIILLKSLLYFVLYEYTFVVSNQLGSVDEDLVNKPFRPLPSGLITKERALYRYIFSLICFIFWAWLLGVELWALLWVGTTLFHNLIGHRNWFTKNTISMTLGILSIIGAGWAIVIPIEDKVKLWAITISFVMGLCAIIQDFRDVEGDRLSKRKTLNIALGDYNARLVSVFICFLSFIIVFFVFILPNKQSWISISFNATVLLLFITISIRLMRFRSSRSDHITYTILLILFNLLLLSSNIYI